MTQRMSRLLFMLAISCLTTHIASILKSSLIRPNKMWERCTMSLIGNHYGCKHRPRDLELNSRNRIDESENELGGSFLSKKIFGLAELFGKISSNAQSKGKDEEASILERNLPSKSLSAIALQIKEEYENIFWVTGNMDLSLWEENCTFSDPFSSFGGEGSLRRFKSNADNLGKLVLQPKMKITSFETADNGKIVKVGWSFSSRLNLPWKPVLAAAGETSHYLNPVNGRIYLYEERWKSKAWDVVRRLFVPTSV